MELENLLKKLPRPVKDVAVYCGGTVDEMRDEGYNPILGRLPLYGQFFGGIMYLSTKPEDPGFSLGVLLVADGVVRLGNGFRSAVRAAKGDDSYVKNFSYAGMVGTLREFSPFNPKKD